MKNEPPSAPSGFDPLQSYGVERMTRIFYAFILIILLALSGGIAILLLTDRGLQAIFLGASLPLVLLGALFSRQRRFGIAAVFLAVVLFLTITVVATFGQGIHHISNLAFPAILIVASLFVRPRTFVFLTAFAACCAAWLVFGELLGLYTPQALVRSLPGDFFSVTITLVATAVIMYLITKALLASFGEAQRELEDRKRAEEQLAYDAFHDSLTGLPNRALFIDRLHQRLERTRRHPQGLFAVLFLDLDRFKVVNDSLGHAVGDQVLVATARRLPQCIRLEDTVSRLSGDEFAVLLDEVKALGDAVRVAERIHAQLASTSMIENFNRVTTASTGIAVYDGRYTNPQEMLRDADSAMYRAKARGGGQTEVFDESMYASALSLFKLETDLKSAVERQEWKVYYQPIVSLPDRALAGVEALVRWVHPQRGIVGPGEFIRVSEETGLILPIGAFVLREACARVQAWREKRPAGLWVSVNLSARQFEDRGLPRLVESTLADTGLPGDSLRLEITESVAMKDPARSAQIMRRLGDLGVRISLDDFGAGYSSFGSLNRLPLGDLKIDRSLVSGIGDDGSVRAINTAIISMGHALALEVIAEGVETEEQLAFLQSVSCDKIQGHLVSAAVPPEDFEKLL